MSIVIEEPDKIDLDLVGYEICGIAKITTWYGNEGEVEMDCEKIIGKKRITKEDIIRHINDGGFGAQSIDGATATIYALYGNHERHPFLLGQARKFVRSVDIEEEDLKSAKRGI